ncbi:MAG: hypothetical protein EOP84_23605 [Verrucomicrobiaceae bacterium]|nr:MAG: hypothetical protein EOP84_23605 [Verrucomicrobiaceae bacterium]
MNSFVDEIKRLQAERAKAEAERPKIMVLHSRADLHTLMKSMPANTTSFGNYEPPPFDGMAIVFQPEMVGAGKVLAWSDQDVADMMVRNLKDNGEGHRIFKER